MINLSEKKNILLSNETRFHLFKHFINLNTDYLRHFINSSAYSEKDILTRLSKQGSKFAFEYAKDPDDLFSKVIDLPINDETIVTRKSGRIEILYKYSESDYPLGIGTDNIVLKSSLTAKQVNEIRYEKRRNDIVSIAMGKGITTWNINIVLREISSEKAGIATVFHGIYAPAFPSDYEKGSDDYIASKCFWDEYVFVEM
jgi:hypothetical protein